MLIPDRDYFSEVFLEGPDVLAKTFVSLRLRSVFGVEVLIIYLLGGRKGAVGEVINRREVRSLALGASFLRVSFLGFKCLGTCPRGYPVIYLGLLQIPSSFIEAFEARWF